MILFSLSGAAMANQCPSLWAKAEEALKTATLDDAGKAKVTELVVKGKARTRRRRPRGGCPRAVRLTGSRSRPEFEPHSIGFQKCPACPGIFVVVGAGHFVPGFPRFDSSARGAPLCLLSQSKGGISPAPFDKLRGRRARRLFAISCAIVPRSVTRFARATSPPPLWG